MLETNSFEGRGITTTGSGAAADDISSASAPTTLGQPPLRIVSKRGAKSDAPSGRLDRAASHRQGRTASRQTLSADERLVGISRQSAGRKRQGRLAPRGVIGSNRGGRGCSDSAIGFRRDHMRMPTRRARVEPVGRRSRWELAESIFGAAWWPIHVAVAWVLTRDREFVERSSRAGRSTLSIEVMLAADEHAGRPTRRYFQGVNAAWAALHEQMGAGSVRACGTPFRRTADAKGNAIETNDIAREIPAVEIATSDLQDDGADRDCLIPKDWRVAHGSNWANLRGYLAVRVFRDDLLRSFIGEADGVMADVPDRERLPPSGSTLTFLSLV
jgi:hypothetical protein